MKLLRASDHKRMPWKNGGGETVEIAVSPDDVGLADFDWRVSMATVATDGPFSVFPGIDRTLSILEAEGMTLFIEEPQPKRLTQASDPLPFAADLPTSATLIDGTITDLNVMTRRGKLEHSIRRVGVAGLGELGVPWRGGVGSLPSWPNRCRRSKLSAGDCLLIEAAAGKRHSASGRHSCLPIEIQAA